MKIEWGACGHPLRDGGCRVCSLVAMTSQEVTDFGFSNDRAYRMSHDLPNNTWDFFCTSDEITGIEIASARALVRDVGTNQRRILVNNPIAQRVVERVMERQRQASKIVIASSDPFGVVRGTLAGWFARENPLLRHRIAMEPDFLSEATDLAMGHTVREWQRAIVKIMTTPNRQVIPGRLTRIFRGLP